MLGCSCRIPGFSCRISGCNCRCSAAIAESLAAVAEYRLHFKMLGCNCGLRMHHAGSPPKKEVRARIARLQLQIADAACRQPAQEGDWGPNGLFAIADCGCTMQAARPKEGLGPEWLVCNCGLRMHHAGSPPKGRVRVADSLLNAA